SVSLLSAEVTQPALAFSLADAAKAKGAIAVDLPPKPLPATESIFVGQPEALKVLDTAMRLNARVVLVLGPEGSGKSTWLRDLELRGLGVSLEKHTADTALQRLLIDSFEQLKGTELA